MRRKTAVPFVILAMVGLGALQAQPRRVSSMISNDRLVRVENATSPRVAQARDLGAAPSDFVMDGVTLHFQPSTTQQADLEQLLRDQQDPASANYHRWLTPEQYADRFGLSADDLRAVTDWLRAQGFTVSQAGRGRSWVAFRGTAASVERVFRTAVHQYSWNGRTHYANATDPQVPEVLRDIVAAIDGLNDFVPEPDSVLVTEANTSSGGHSLAPDDIATIYGLQPLYKAGIDGTGQSIVVVGQSAIDLADLRAYRAKYNLPALDPQVILNPNSSDPGTTSSLGEGNLDLDAVSAVARNAKIVYVYGRSAFSALSYAVDQKLAPVVTASYSFGCESYVGPSSAISWRLVAMQANAQGMTWVNSSGDAGAAGCDTNSSLIAQNGLGARFPASIPEVTGVGGTQFADSGGTWWASTNDSNGASALSYVPETVWNTSVAYSNILGGGGGRSILYTKPSWQSAPGVPDDGARGVPDISFAASGHTPYNVISGGKSVLYYGTSASAPAFAGMLVLLNQKLVASGALATAGLGNVNPALYQVARNAPSVFHDINTGSNAVPCAAGSPDCVGGVVGYAAGAGYDLATGLGSANFSQMADAWPTTAPTESDVLFNISANPVYKLATPTAAGNSWTFTLTASEQAGVATKMTDFHIAGVSYASDIARLFGSTDIPAHGYRSASMGSKSLNVPVDQTFEIRGVDASGKTWTRTLTAKFTGFPPTPVIGGVAHGASFTQAFAPGMVLSVFGTDLTAGKSQAAAVVPLTTFMGETTATVNGVSAPFYYVSPGQINLQIPYETATGNARLVINNGYQSGTFSFNVAATAPGIFVGGDNFTVPYATGGRGATLILFITGEGAVTPSIATGGTPSSSPYPKPKASYSMSIGGVDARSSSSACLRDWLA